MTLLYFHRYRLQRISIKNRRNFKKRTDSKTFFCTKIKFFFTETAIFRHLSRFVNLGKNVYLVLDDLGVKVCLDRELILTEAFIDKGIMAACFIGVSWLGHRFAAVSCYDYTSTRLGVMQRGK